VVSSGPSAERIRLNGAAACKRRKGHRRWRSAGPSASFNGAAACKRRKGDGETAAGRHAQRASMEPPHVSDGKVRTAPLLGGVRPCFNGAAACKRRKGVPALSTEVGTTCSYGCEQCHFSALDGVSNNISTQYNTLIVKQFEHRPGPPHSGYLSQPSPDAPGVRSRHYGSEGHSACRSLLHLR
jgi:hypothetical protein